MSSAALPPVRSRDSHIKTLSYAVVEGTRSVAIRREPIPAPGPRDILVRTRCSGISAGTEMAVFRGSLGNLRTKRWGYWTEYPIRPGYELVGTVIDRGSAVTDVVAGDRVVCHAPHASHAVVAVEDYARIPDGLTDEDATLAMLGATTAHGIRRAAIDYGETVLVLGLGVVGLLASDHAVVAGASRVLLADPQAWKRDFAVKRGVAGTGGVAGGPTAALPLDPGSPDFQEAVLEATGGAGIDLVIEASGNPAAVETGLRALRRGGRLLLQGTLTEAVSLDFSDYILHKELHLIGTWGKGPRESPTGWTRKRNQELALRLLADGRLRAEGLVSHRFEFDELPEVYRLIDQGALDYLQIVLRYE